MPKTVILGTARTPFGKMGGGALLARRHRARRHTRSRPRSSAPASTPEQVQQVVFGQVLQAGQGQIPSRQAQIKAGIPKEVPSETINKVCASGMRTIGLADQAIRAGDLEVARHRRHGVDEPGAPTCCPAPASASGWATSRRSTR